MGWGEIYMNDWIRYFTKELGVEAKLAYIRANPAPADWPDWYQTIEVFARIRAEDEAWMEAHKAKEKAPRKAPPLMLRLRSRWSRFWRR